MGRYYSPSGNCEIWDEKPRGYFTEEEATEQHPEWFRGTTLDKQLMAELAAAQAEAEAQTEAENGATAEE